VKTEMASRFRLAAAAFVLAGCAATSRPAADSSRAEVEAAMQQYTARLRDPSPDALVAMVAPDGEMLEPGMPSLRGRDAIRAFLAPLAAAVTVEAATSQTDAIDVRGDAAYVWGSYSETVVPHDGPRATYTGRFVAEWRRGDGRWLLRRMLVQPSPQ
jgi:uncharacterized protein (TIGR02246 family)